MKVKTFTLMLFALIAVTLTAQTPTSVVKEASVAPIIDGDIDAVWADAPVEVNNLPFGTEVPTAEATWQGLWTKDGIYLLVIVTDDNFYPHYMNTANPEYEMDKLEIYFDANFDKIDGLGAKDGKGHYQVAPGIDEANIDGTAVTWDNGVVFAHKVTDPNYVAEFFVPYSLLKDKDGIGVDVTGEIGFDVTLVDRDAGDAGRRRLVWANDGPSDSWGSMNDCGIITLEGAELGILVDEIFLTGGDITENNGTVQIQAEVLPVEADNKEVAYSVENGTGRATVSSTGLVTAILDGDVTIKALAADGGWAEASLVVNISNQIVTLEEINVIKNPYFDDVQENGEAENWGGWGEHGDPMPQIIDGVANMTPTPKSDGNPEQWHYQYNQNNLQALPDVDYEFSFVAWADEAVNLPVDFEDIESNGYARYGKSLHPAAVNGESEWHIDITTTPTKYVMDVNFDRILANTDQKVQFMPGLLNVVVYLDSVILVNNDDLALLTPHTPVEAITVSGGTGVAVGATLQMSAEVLPAEATYKDVKWSVVPGTGWASIDAAGVLTGDTAGTVLVMASAVDDSRSFGELEVTVTSTVGISQSKVNTLKVYPNPAVNELNVVLEESNSTVTVYNSVGMKVDEVIVTGNTHKFDVSSYASGLYFVKTVDSVAKFIK